MSEHLDKAKAALAHAAELDLDMTDDSPLPPVYARLLDQAQIQAQIAQADALERLADVAERAWLVWSTPTSVVEGPQ